MKDCNGKPLEPYPIEATVVACAECKDVFRTEAGVTRRISNVQDYATDPRAVKSPIGGFITSCRSHKGALDALP